VADGKVVRDLEPEKPAQDLLRRLRLGELELDALARMVGPLQTAHLVAQRGDRDPVPPADRGRAHPGRAAGGQGARGSGGRRGEHEDGGARHDCIPSYVGETFGVTGPLSPNTASMSCPHQASSSLSRRSEVPGGTGAPGRAPGMSLGTGTSIVRTAGFSTVFG